MTYITLGVIVKSRGLNGEVKVLSSTQFALERYQKGRLLSLYDEKKDIRHEVKLANYRSDAKADYLTFQNHPTVESILPFIGCLVQIQAEEARLEEGYYFYHELLGLEVYDEEHRRLGVVSKIEEYAAYATLRVKREEGNDLLVPFVQAFIMDVNLANRSITIHLLEGML